MHRHWGGCTLTLRILLHQTQPALLSKNGPKFENNLIMVGNLYNCMNTMRHLLSRRPYTVYHQYESARKQGGSKVYSLQARRIFFGKFYLPVWTGQQLFLGKLYRSLDKWYFLVVWLNRFALNFLYKYNTMVPIPKKTIEQYIEYEYVILKPLFHALVIFPLTCHSHASFKYN